MTQLRTPNGNALTIVTRPAYNDEAVVLGILGDDEYRLKGLKLTGWALDIGAHVGTVGLALAVDNPGLQVILVEPVPDNAALIRKSIEANGLTERCHLVEAAADDPKLSTAVCRYGYRKVEGQDPGYVQQNAFVGNIWTLTDDDKYEAESVTVPVVTIASLAKTFGAERFAFCKIDCEGCEWGFFKKDVRLLDRVAGEWHDGSLADFRKLFARTHDFEVIHAYGEETGIFSAVRKA